MEIFLTEGAWKNNLFPFTEIRHTADIRIGILTIREKWERLTGKKITLASGNENMPGDSVMIDANIIPTQENFKALLRAAQSKTAVNEWDKIKILVYPWHISQYNDWAIRQDFQIITKARLSKPIPKTNNVLKPENIFIEEGIKMEFCILNASEGPIYIGNGVQLMEGTMLRGPVAVCDNSVIKMGSKLYGGTTIGPDCVAGGEIKNSVMFACSNKAHDGYLGDSVIGEWCNLGAGTSNSNLKNTAGEVIFNIDGELVNAGCKAGLMMGDYSRAAINTSFNTGTIVGICCNIFGSGILPRLIRNFSWGEELYILEKALRDIENWKKLKNKNLSATESKKLTELYNK